MGLHCTVLSCPGVSSSSLRPHLGPWSFPWAPSGGLQGRLNREGGARDAGSFLYASSAPRQCPAWLQYSLHGEKEGQEGKGQVHPGVQGSLLRRLPTALLP